MADVMRMTLLDFAKSKDANGVQAQVIELMNQYNPVLQDAPAYASDSPTGNRVTFRRTLPSVGTAKFNKGVVRSKSSTDQAVDPIGFFAGLSEVDVRLKEVEGAAAYAKKRSDEDKAFEEALAQTVAENIFYGNTKTDEAAFDGLAPRMAALNAGTTMTGSQVHSMGTVTGSDGCSIYIIDWGERAAHLIFPKNSVAGLIVKDRGEQRVEDAEGNPFFADTTSYDWFVGLSVRDPRHIARLANIDLSDSKLASPTQGILTDALETIMSYMPAPGGAKRVLYCPIKLWSAFTKQARGHANQALSIQDYLNEPTPHFWGYPIRKVEKLTVAEATVS